MSRAVGRAKLSCFLVFPLVGRSSDLPQQSPGHDQRQPVSPPRQHQRPATQEREKGQPVGVGQWG